jgi:hypothetical protein
LPSKKAILSIANPCSENWGKMSDAACGKFCGACQKHVIDFTAMSDTELGRIINTIKGEICGRMTPEQMNRPIVLETYPSHWSARWLVALSALASFSGTLLAKPMHHLPDINIFQNNTSSIIPELNSFHGDSTRSVKIKIIDDRTNEPVQFATILVNEINFNITTNEYGFAEILISESYRHDTLNFKIFRVGYKTTDVHLNLRENVINKIAITRLSAHYTGSICIVLADKPTLWQKLKSKFRREKH